MGMKCTCLLGLEPLLMDDRKRPAQRGRHRRLCSLVMSPLDWDSPRCDSVYFISGEDYENPFVGSDFSFTPLSVCYSKPFRNSEASLPA
ncbi:hypothetical protein IGI04_007234 [Brassica rapa subsp. trilocularis]|uniref:DUF295 domain-containing protein n=1 Tax=Brassica rapa subsp. trilocularis TaxID=1813537 RepID=A0ABQ7NJ44_BRACM|nr:hypothetical protein IGI04_007234 [Brassica rapa subsp. trilocularis]